MNPKPDQEGFMDLLSEVDPSLDVMPPVQEGGNGNGSGRKVLGELIEVKPEEEWADDGISVAFNKVRSAFLKGKTAFDIKAFARTLSEAAWIELALKMAPKQVDVNALQITAVRIELPPRVPCDVDVIDIEVPV